MIEQGSLGTLGVGCRIELHELCEVGGCWCDCHDDRAALERRCPICEAAPGDPCVTAGILTPKLRPHESRRFAT